MSTTPVTKYDLKLVNEAIKRITRNNAVPFTEFEASNVVITTYPQKNPEKTKIIGHGLNIEYKKDGRQSKLYLETPPSSYTRFGLTDGFKSNGNYSILIQQKTGCDVMRDEVLKGMDKFYSELQKLDQMVKDFCIENYELLFNKSYSLEMRKEMMNSNFFSIVKDKSTETMSLPLQINLKCPKFKDTNIPELTFTNINVRDKDEKIHPMEDISFDMMSDIIKPHSYITCDFQVVFWTVNGNCGLKCDAREILYIKTSDISQSRYNNWGTTFKYENLAVNNSVSKSDVSTTESNELPSKSELEEQLKDAKKFSSEEEEEDDTEEVSVEDSDDEEEAAPASV